MRFFGALIRNGLQGTYSLLALIVVGFLCSAAPGAQPQQGPPGTIRVKVTLVPVNVRVTDANNEPVLDLTKEDFVVLENGMRQEIRHLSVEKLTAQTSMPDQKALLRSISPLELTPNTNRTF